MFAVRWPPWLFSKLTEAGANAVLRLGSGLNLGFGVEGLGPLGFRVLGFRVLGLQKMTKDINMMMMMMMMVMVM